MKPRQAWYKLPLLIIISLVISASSKAPVQTATGLDLQACPAGELPLFMGGTCTGGGPVRTTINAAIADASDGWTVWVEAGTFNENVSIDKRITLRGVGSGTNPASNTIITALNVAQGGIQVVVPGTVAQPITIMNLRVTGAFGGSGNNDSGIHLRGTGIENIIIDNVAAVNNAGRGLAIDTSGGDVLNITVRNSDLSNNTLQGFRLPSSAGSAKGLVIENCTIDNNGQSGIEINYHPGEITEITVKDTTLTGNGGTAPSGSGGGGIILYQYSGAAAGNNITANFTNVTVTGPVAPSNDRLGFYINARNNNTTAGTYNFNNVEINGDHTYDIRFRRFSDMSGVSMNYVRAFGNSDYGVLGRGVTGPTLDLGNTQFSNSHALYDVALTNDSAADIDARSAHFFGTTTLAEVQARVSDSPAPGTGVILEATPDVTAPQVANQSFTAVVVLNPTMVVVTFSEDVSDLIGDTGTDDVTNPANYLLYQAGPNGVYDTTTCAGGITVDDVMIDTGGVVYDNSLFEATVTLNGGTALPDGNYQFMVCGTTSIVDMANIPLGGGTDYVVSFTVGESTIAKTSSEPTSSFSLPATGFPPKTVTTVPVAHNSNIRLANDGIVLEIPQIGLVTSIVGVPQSSNGWDVSWLGQQAGYLYGTAFPTLAGNTVLTGHVWDADGTPGIFDGIHSLQHGDEFFIHAWGLTYTYEVQTRYLTYASSMTPLEHSEYDLVTLLTCEGFSEWSGDYRYRRVVQAVLISVE